MKKDVDILKTWYRSIRTRYTRILHQKSGDGTTQLTERDKWILANFNWLRSHVTEVQKKTTVSIKEKTAAAAASVDGNTDDQSEDPTDIESESNRSQRLNPLSRRSSKSSSKKATEEEERLFSNMATRQEQSIAIQSKVLEMLAPPKATERTRYADWAKEVMVSLHPSLWLKFQRECSNLLYTYQEKSEALLNPMTQQQPYPFPQAPYATQHQTFPSAATGISPASAMMQPPFQQWPPTSQENMSVWTTQNAAWGQGQIAGLQPLALGARRPSPVPACTRPTTSTDSQSAEPAISLSNIVRDTIGLQDNSFESSIGSGE